MRKTVILATLALTSCVGAHSNSPAEGWPPEPDDSCWNIDSVQDYLEAFSQRLFAAWLHPGMSVRFVIAADGTVARYEIGNDPDAKLSASTISAFNEFSAVPVPPEAQCIVDVTLTGVLGTPEGGVIRI